MRGARATTQSERRRLIASHAAMTAYMAAMADETNTTGANPDARGLAALDLGDGPRPADADGDLGRRPEAGRSPGRDCRLHGAPSRRPSAPASPVDDRSGRADERRRRGLGEGPRDLGQDDRASTRTPKERRQGPSLRRARMAAKTRSSTPSARPIWRLSDKLLGYASRRSKGWTRRRGRAAVRVRSFVDAMSPSNFALTNPQVLKRTIETRGENLLKGLANMLNDIAAGQLTQTKAGAFEVGKNLATTPGKVVKETPLYQLIQYTPTTDEVLETPVVIFPPWINRFYILDLTPEKSFVKWCVDQGITLFMVSWKSADESIADADARRLCAAAARSTRSTPSATCSASRACTPSAIASRARRWRRRSPISTRKKQADKVKSATFLTAQVDFAQAGDLKLFTRRRDDGAARRADARTRAISTAATWPRRSTCCAAATSSGTMSSTIICSARSRRRSTCCTGIRDTTNLPAELAPRLSRDALQGEQAGRARRHQGRRHADRHRQGEDADLHPGRPRGPYRAARKRVEDHGPFRRRRSASCSPARAISRAWSIRRPPRNINIGSTTSRAGDARNRSSTAPRSTRAAGGRTGSNG